MLTKTQLDQIKKRGLAGARKIDLIVQGQNQAFAGKRIAVLLTRAWFP